MLKEEAEFDDNLVGHIDMVQVRNNKIHILDYKPELINEKYAISQLSLYALALSKRTNIGLSKIVCAYFNQDDYFQFYPEMDLIEL